jgi:glutamate synthase domain-containing protein 3
MRIEAKGIYYKELNEKIQEALDNGAKKIILDNVNGQRYIGDGLRGSNIKVIINGTPGNDLAAFMDGPTIVVNSNAQDGIGNTMNAGKIIVYGDAGDIVGYSMRGGKIYIKGDVGYRVGIHMKAYQDLYPVIIVGGTARDFLGEYMAGGLIIILGLNKEDGVPLVGSYVGTGMHGGRIYIRGKVEEYRLGKEINLFALAQDDRDRLNLYLEEYCQDFNLNLKEILKDKFIKLIPYTHRPYGSLYAY